MPSDQEKEVDTEVIHESGNQSGDTVLLEHNHDIQQESLDAEDIDKHVIIKDSPWKRRVAGAKLKKLRHKYQKLQKTVKRLCRKLKGIANDKAQHTTPEVVSMAT